MFENPKRGRQARNFTTNVPKILVLKSSSERIFPKIPVGCPCRETTVFCLSRVPDHTHTVLRNGETNVYARRFPVMFCVNSL